VKTLLISANTERILMPSLPLGLSLVAAAARQAGHEIQFLDLLAEPDPDAAVRRSLIDGSPQVIGVSVRNIDDQNMASPRFLLEDVRRVIAACRVLSSAPIILGGAGYSIYPRATLEYLGADLGVCGEGEVVFPALLDRLEQGQDPAELAGVYLAGRNASARRFFAQDLDRLPWPGDDLWLRADPQDPAVWIPVQTRRGCPLECSYCSTPDLEGRRPRARSPVHVAEHVAGVAEAGFRRFYFVDNTFNLPPSYATELCRRLSSLPWKIQWSAILYPHAVPGELIQAMAEAGCTEVSLGFESGSLPVLKAMNKRFDPAEVRQISDRLAGHGIRQIGFLLLGGPGETRQSVDESLAFADSLNLAMLSIAAGIRIYPHTPLARIAVQQGIIAPDDDLLRPRFYMSAGLEDYIRRAVAARNGTGGQTRLASGEE